MHLRKATTLACLGLVLLAALLPAQTEDDTIHLTMSRGTLEQALRVALRGVRVEGLEGSLEGEGLASRIQVVARNVPRDRFVEVMLSAAGLEGNVTGGTLWVRPATGDETRVVWEDLVGFEKLVVGDRDVYSEARERAEARLDPLTRAYLRHRRALEDRQSGNELQGGDGWMGIQLGAPRRALDSMPTSLAEAVAHWDGWGAFVLDVVPDSPASRSGLMPGDVIVKYSGIWVESPATLIRLASRSETGREVELEVLRDGTVRREYLVVGRRPDTDDESENRQPSER